MREEIKCSTRKQKKHQFSGQKKNVVSSKPAELQFKQPRQNKRRKSDITSKEHVLLLRKGT
jgi:hypothetical protein